jgi:hypothetical protein
VGLGVVVRHQVPTVVGLCAWLLFVETVLLGDVGLVSDVARFTPGALAPVHAGCAGEGGQRPGPAAGPGQAVVQLALHAAAAVVAGWVATTRRDVV